MSKLPEFGIYVNNYLDDIYVISETAEKNITLTKRVIASLQQNGLKLRLDKCQFLKKEIKHLGRIINANGIRIQQKHISKLIAFPVPKTEKQLRQFLGLINWLNTFIPHLNQYKSFFKSNTYFKQPQSLQNEMVIRIKKVILINKNNIYIIHNQMHVWLLVLMQQTWYYLGHSSS